MIGDASNGMDKKIAAVLHGGCGRREVAPFSDVDLMLHLPGRPDGRTGRIFPSDWFRTLTIPGCKSDSV